jgi:non-specific serine/threonine protein kinase/serine/threonine-protein kinase
MSSEPAREEELFCAALELPPEKRVAFVRERSGDDSALAESVEALLALHLSGDELDDSVDSWLGAELRREGGALAEEDLSGQVLGAYHVKERLGEGGTGIVYRAEQEEPIRRELALKCVKPGMDTREVLTRFAAERQTLALMNHPGIAKVIDAGATARGRPFFVMELVEGQPLQRYCDERRLNLSARLELFRTICQAVEHAHQKGVIHRDLKPSNILVTDTPAGPAPKIIDFGIAKALSARRREDGTLTRHAEFIGTPSYMSPEQARSDADLDTRTDVYSLGAILHELLSGSPPVSAAEWTAGGLDTLRELKSSAPRRPSLRVRGLPEDEREKVSRERGLTPSRLTNRLKGDLDWVVQHSLEPERDRRYATVGELAEDVRRALADEPVVAVAPGWWYLLGKSVRRHRVAYAAGAVVAVTLVAATVVSRQQAVRAGIAERHAEQEAAISRALAEFMQQDVLAQAAPDRQPDRSLTVTQALTNAAEGIEGKFAQQPLVEAEVRQTIGTSLLSMGEFVAALPQLRRAWELNRTQRGETHPDTLAARADYLRGLQAQGFFDEAEAVGTGLVELLTEQLGADDEITLAARQTWGLLRLKQARFKEAVSLLEQVSNRREILLGPNHPLTLESLGHLSRCFGLMHNFPEAERRLGELIKRQTEALGPEDLRTLNSRQALGNTYNRQAKARESMEIYEDVYRLRLKVQGENHPDTIGLLQNMGSASLKMFRTEEAVDYFRRAHAALAESVGLDHPSALMSQLTLGNALIDMGDHAEAAATLQDCYERAQRKFGPDHYRTTDVQTVLAQCLGQQKRYDESRAMFEAALASRIEHYGEKSARVLFTSLVYVMMLEEMGDFETALPLMQRTHEYSLETNGVININTPYMAGQLMKLHLLMGNPAATVAVGDPLVEGLREAFPDRHIIGLFELRLGSAHALLGNDETARGLVEHAEQLLAARWDRIPPADKDLFEEELAAARAIVAQGAAAGAEL